MMLVALHAMRDRLIEAGGCNTRIWRGFGVPLNLTAVNFGDLFKMERFLKDYKSKDNKGPPSKRTKTSEGDKKKRKKEYEEKRVREFQPSWLDKFDWLEFHVINQKGRMFCKPCRRYEKVGTFITGSSNFKIDSLISHQSSSSHVKNETRKIVEKKGGPMDKGILDLNKQEADHLKILFRNAHALAIKERPFTDFTMLCDLDEAKGLPVQKTLYRNDKRCREFVESIADLERLKIGQLIEKAKFISIMSDGATDSSHVEAEICYIRVCHEGEIFVHFVAVKNIPKADAEGITNAIMEMIDKAFPDVEWKSKVVGLGSDGASVMLGKKGGVIAKMRTRLQKPRLVAVHCSAHRLELAYKDACKNVNLYGVVSTLLSNLYLFYRNSSLNRSNLKESFKTFKETPLMPTRVSGTRWLPHTLRAIGNVLRGYKAVVRHLTQVRTPFVIC